LCSLYLRLIFLIWTFTPGAPDERVETFYREFRALVLGIGQHDLPVAAFDKDLGKGFRQRLPA
jgi:hypothetical protein